MADEAPERQQQEKAVESLRDWCKWMIGLNLTMGAGCVLVLLRGVSATLKTSLVSAIIFFGVSMIIAALIIAVLPSIIQRLPLYENSERRPSNIYTAYVAPLLTLKILASLQYAFFVLGIIFLFTWIVLKPPG
jgi:hypothetical protein